MLYYFRGRIMKLNIKRTLSQSSKVDAILKNLDIKEEPIIKTGIFDIASAVRFISPLFKVDFEDFSFKNRKGQIIEGRLCRPNGKGVYNLMPADAGLRTGVTFELPHIAIYLARTGYVVYSVQSKAEVMGGEGLDYIDALYYLRDKYSFIGNLTAPLGISSGGAAVALKIASDIVAVKNHNIKCVVAAAAYADLAEMWKYAVDYVNTHDLNDHRTKVLIEYLQYAADLGMDPGTNPEVFDNASPINYAKDINIPTLLVHGVEDQVVPVEQSIKLYKKMKELGKDVKLKIVWGEGVHAPTLEMITELPDFVGLLQTISATQKFLKEHMNPIIPQKISDRAPFNVVNTNVSYA